MDDEEVNPTAIVEQVLGAEIDSREAVLRLVAVLRVKSEQCLLDRDELANIRARLRAAKEKPQ